MEAVRTGDVAAVRGLLERGVNPRIGDGTETPLHAAARSGPLAVVEALIEGGALEWYRDAAGRTALEVARAGESGDRDAIVALLDRDAIAESSFRAVVGAIHAGDVAALERLLDANPRLLRERNVGPEPYRRAKRRQYFLDPKLFWYVANNPTLVERMAPNIVEVAGVMLARGVEPVDLDYTLQLTATSLAARMQGLQQPLMRLLLEAGATVTRETVIVTAAHWELDALRVLVATGPAIDPCLAAAACGDVAELASALPYANAQDVQAAFGLAVINRHNDAATLALDAGADVDAPLPVHAHSTALHQAVVNDDAAAIALLLARGANPDVRDALWDATPLDWAIHENRPAARGALERGLHLPN